MTETRMCYATPSKARAILAIGAPIFGFGFAIITIWDRGYSLTDYPLLIREGHLNWFSQGMGWIAVAAWIALFWPPAFSAIRESCLIYSQGSSIKIASSDTLITKSEIHSIQVRWTFFNKIIEFKTSNCHIFIQSAIFIKEDVKDVIDCLKADVANSGKPNSGDTIAD